jgi:hypothetical protein
MADGAKPILKDKAVELRAGEVIYVFDNSSPRARCELEPIFGTKFVGVSIGVYSRRKDQIAPLFFGTMHRAEKVDGGSK